MKRLILILALSVSTSAQVAGPFAQNGSAGFGTAIWRANSKFVPSVDSTITDCVLMTSLSGASTGNCAIYDSDGTAGAPHTLLCAGTARSLSNGSPTYNDFPLSGCGTAVAGHTYWVASDYDVTGPTEFTATVADAEIYYNLSTSLPFPNPAPSLTHVTGVQWGIQYAILSPLSGQQCGAPTLLQGINNRTPAKNIVYASPCVPAANSTVARCRVYIGFYDATPGNINCAVYSDSTGPANVICQGTAQAVTSGDWKTIPISGCGTLNAGTTYWVAINHDQDNLTIAQQNDVSGGYDKAQTYGTFTNISSPTATYELGIYLDLAAVPSAAGQAHIF